MALSALPRTENSRFQPHQPPHPTPLSHRGGPTSPPQLKPHSAQTGVGDVGVTPLILLRRLSAEEVRRPGKGHLWACW